MIRRDKVAEKIKQIIDDKGFEYLENSAFDIYKTLIVEGLADGMHSRVLLSCLLSGDYRTDEKQYHDKASLSAGFRKNCGLTKKIADEMAVLFIKIFSKVNIEEWENMKFSGLKKFFGNEWNFKWERTVVWEKDSSLMDCSVNGTATLKVTEPSSAKSRIKNQIEQNPFISDEDIEKIFKHELESMLTNDFQMYCYADDYYPPTADDYAGNFEDIVKEFCQTNGMELVEWDFRGENSNYY